MLSILSNEGHGSCAACRFRCTVPNTHVRRGGQEQLQLLEEVGKAGFGTDAVKLVLRRWLSELREAPHGGLCYKLFGRLPVEVFYTRNCYMMHALLLCIAAMLSDMVLLHGVALTDTATCHRLSMQVSRPTSYQ